MSILQRLGKGIDKISLTWGQLGFWLLLFIVFTWSFEVISRRFGFVTYFFGPLGAYLTVLYPYFCSAYAMSILGHIRITVISDRFNEQTRTWLELMAYALFLIYTGIFTWFFIKWTQAMMASGTYSAQMPEVQMWWLYLTASAGWVLLGLQIIRAMVKVGKKLHSEKLGGGKSFFSKPYFVLPLIIVLIGVSYWSFSVNAILGINILLLVLLFTSMPIAGSLGLVAVLGIVSYGGMGLLNNLAHLAYAAMADTTWLAMPAFILGGLIFSRGLGAGLWRLVRAWVGWLPGGIGVATVWLGVMFGAMMGSLNGALLALVYFALPELDKGGYARSLSLPLMGASCIIGVLIPPSMPLVIFGSLTEISIGALFMGGIGPGITLAIIFSVYVVFWAIRTGGVERYLPGWGERFRAIPGSIIAMGVPIIVIGGILSGLTTPTEAGCVMVAYVLLVSFGRRFIRPSFREVNPLGYELNRVMGYLCLAIIGALMVGKVFGYYRIPSMIADWLVMMEMGKWAIFAMLMGLFLLLGCVGEVFVVMIILVPILMPTLVELGFHPWWLGIMFTMQIGLGGITPPVGGLVFITAAATKTEPYFIMRHVLPWVIMDLIMLVITLQWQQIVIWIPLHTGFTPPVGF